MLTAPLRRVAVTAATAAALLAPGAAAHATGVASHPASGLTPLVLSGGVHLPATAHLAGPLPARTRVQATVALRVRRPAALAAYAAAVSTPGSPEYHRYLSVAAFRARFAPPASAVQALAAHLRAEGFTVGAPTANGLALPVTARASVAGGALGTTLERFITADGGTGTAPVAAPHITGAGSGVVQGVIGLDTLAPTASGRMSGAAHRRPVKGTRVASSPTSATTAGPQPCAAARSAASEDGAFTADQIALRYGLAGFYAAGDEGAGMTIAVYELEPFSASDVAQYQACMGTSANVTVEMVDGGAGSGPGSGEAATDVEDLIGLAPKAQIRVYEGAPSGVGAYETYATIISEDAASIVSTSWGLCESEQGAAAAQAENTLFQEAAVQGQTILAASGDSGADDCGDGQLSVDDPASQPWVTGVGGTTANATGDVVWNSAIGAGGGGASELWARPAWQTGYVAQSSVSCGTAGTSCREVPDLSADADPAAGYVAYYRGSWRTFGGTSVAAPTVAALVALANASPACAGRRLGFINPALYADAADFTDVTSGDNSYDGVTGFAAGPGYDMASGLGTPTAALGPALCGDALTLATPAAQSWSVGHAVTLTLSATSARGAAITWSAIDLPAGLTLNAASGRISGTPTTAGHGAVTVTAVDGDGATQSAAFTVTIAGQARTATVHHGGHTLATSASAIVIGRIAALTGTEGRSVRERVRARDAHHLTLRFSAAGLPRGVRIDPRTGVISGTPRGTGSSTARVTVSDGAGATSTTVVRWRITAVAGSHSRIARSGR